MTLKAARAARTLADKITLVTGAASGIGRAQARLFAAAGSYVVAVDRDGAGLSETAAEHEAIYPMPADLTRIDDITRLVTDTITRFGRIDVLSNTAGIHDGYLRSLDTDEETWDRIFAVNVKAVFRLTNAVLPGMLERGAGIIINVASIAATVAGGGGPAYTASKHAVLGYTRQISYEYGRRGIRANALCPGMVKTGMTRDVLAAEDSKLRKAIMAVPAGRYALPEEIAEVSLFLASDASSFIHGAAMIVDGGLTVK